jgi:thioredoxin 2
VTLSCDESGIFLPCPSCQAENRIPFARIGSAARCGHCRAPLPSPGAPVDVPSASAYSQLKALSPLPIVIDFWAPWCGPCRMMAPEFAKAAAMAKGEFLFAKINTDSLPDVASDFNLKGIPAVALLRQGHPPPLSTRAQPASQLLAWLRSQ